ncbi:hypothetical protein [Hymenobacter fodinae]|nr:hypothetical protein [Hymenobacter fodinae]
MKLDRPTEHLASLNKRRQQMQLELVQDYLQRATTMHRQMNANK